jgi:hypothetical protein
MLEPIFWRSAWHAALRLIGASRLQPFTVIVHVERLPSGDWWPADAGTVGGLYTSRVVLAATEQAASEEALGLVMGDVRVLTGQDCKSSGFAIEGVTRGPAIAFRQLRGSSFYPAEDESP